MTKFKDTYNFKDQNSSNNKQKSKEKNYNKNILFIINYKL